VEPDESTMYALYHLLWKLSPPFTDRSQWKEKKKEEGGESEEDKVAENASESAEELAEGFSKAEKTLQVFDLMRGKGWEPSDQNIRQIRKIFHKEISGNQTLHEQFCKQENCPPPLPTPIPYPSEKQRVLLKEVYDNVLQGQVEAGCSEWYLADYVFEEMKKRHLGPDEWTYHLLIVLMSRGKETDDWAIVLQTFEDMMGESGLEPLRETFAEVLGVLRKHEGEAETRQEIIEELKRLADLSGPLHRKKTLSALLHKIDPES